MGKRIFKFASTAVLLLCLAGAPPVWAALQGENLLTSIPPGFKVGSSGHNAAGEIQEWAPTGETVNNWSALITVQIFHHLQGVSPQAFIGRVAAGWRSACPAGTAIDIQEGVENGYHYSFWSLTCPRNPETGKPENMWAKAIAGSDALYSVQYAFRKPPAPDLTITSAKFLRQVQVCDTRRPDRPCPRGM
jgi:hypothetical protein